MKSIKYDYLPSSRAFSCLIYALIFFLSAAVNFAGIADINILKALSRLSISSGSFARPYGI